MHASVIVLLYVLSSIVQGAKIQPKQIKNLVTFGDSFTDIDYVASWGTLWPVYAAGYAGVKLFPYAKAGAVCSNITTPRPYPTLFETQIPTYLDDKANRTVNLESEHTVYTLWIGTNDLSYKGLLTGSAAPGASLVAVTDCMVNWVKVLHVSGARNFIFQNMIPLENTPIYSRGSYPNRWWRAQRNTTEWNIAIRELVLSGNELTKLKLQNLASKLRGLNIAIFDSHGLFADIYAHPTTYLNGTAPLNVTTAIDACIYEIDADTPSSCTVVQGSDRDSYLWYDELHPTEQANRVVAREIAKVVQGRESRWVTWL